MRHEAKFWTLFLFGFFVGVPIVVTIAVNVLFAIGFLR